MKILQINVNANSGSTGKIATDIKNALEEQGHQCIIAYGANNTVQQSGYVRICSENERKFNALCSRITGIKHGCFGFLSTKKLIKLIERECPDIVHLQCPNGYIVDLFRILEYLANSGTKTVVSNHAEYFYTGTCGHALNCHRWFFGCGKCPIYRKETKSLIDSTAYSWRRFEKAFKSFDPEKIILTTVSPWLNSRIAESQYLRKFRREIVMNGLDTSVFKHREVGNTTKERFDHSKKLVLFVSASFTDFPNDFKGGDKVIELAKKMNDVQFCIAASYCKVSSKLPPNVILWGRASSQVELAELYSLADCTVIASMRETFSMVTAESLCCGTPVAGFLAGGPESIALSDYAKFVEYGDILTLEKVIRNFINCSIDIETLTRQSHSLYSINAMVNNYIKVYNQLLAEA